MVHPGDVLPTSDGGNTVVSINASGVVVRWYGREIHLSQVPATTQGSSGNQPTLPPSLFPAGAIPANVQPEAAQPTAAPSASPPPR